MENKDQSYMGAQVGFLISPIHDSHRLSAKQPRHANKQQASTKKTATCISLAAGTTIFLAAHHHPPPLFECSKRTTLPPPSALLHPRRGAPCRTATQYGQQRGVIRTPCKVLRGAVGQALWPPGQPLPCRTSNKDHDTTPTQRSHDVKTTPRRRGRAPQ